VHGAFDDEEFSTIVPEPPDLGLPIPPIEEYNKAPEGGEIFVNPLDHDGLHIRDHHRCLEQMAQDPDKDKWASDTLLAHVCEHMQQARQKQLMQARAKVAADPASSRSAASTCAV
jgi:hypothetical protein